MELTDWLQSNGLDNPHNIPEDLKYEFKDLYGEYDILWPQPGGQTDFLNCEADVMFYGGEAGAGRGRARRPRGPGPAPEAPAVGALEIILC